MILDAIVALFAPLFEGLAALAVGAINLLFAGLEMVVALFVPAFQMKRIERKKQGEGENAARASRSVALIGGGVVALLILGAVFMPMLTKRSITLVAKDGHSLPYAAVILHTSSGDEHLRSDNAGNLNVQRFGLNGITVKDPRYVEQTWRGDAITRQLVVSRTVLGSSLDRLAGKLLKPSGE